MVLGGFTHYQKDQGEGTMILCGYTQKGLQYPVIKYRIKQITIKRTVISVGFIHRSAEKDRRYCLIL